jgi:hypothetical protein
MTFVTETYELSNLATSLTIKFTGHCVATRSAVGVSEVYKACCNLDVKVSTVTNNGVLLL